MNRKYILASFLLLIISSKMHTASFEENKLKILTHKPYKFSIINGIKSFNNGIAYGPLVYDSCKAIKEYIPYLFDKKYQNKKIEFLKKNNLATDTLSHSIKNEVRAVLKECNISQANTIPILEYKNLDCPAAIHEGPIVLVDVNQFMALSPDMRRAYIGHEAMHIKHNDIHNDSLFIIALPLLVYATVKAYTTSSNALLNSIKKTTQNDKIKASAKLLILLNSIAANFFKTKLTLADFLEALYFKRSEKRADLESVQALNNAKDAIKLYEYALEQNGEIDSIFAHHPSFKDRLAYFVKYVKMEA